jgi:hypothetical protein
VTSSATPSSTSATIRCTCVGILRASSCCSSSSTPLASVGRGRLWRFRSPCCLGRGIYRTRCLTGRSWSRVARGHRRAFLGRINVHDVRRRDFRVDAARHRGCRLGVATVGFIRQGHHGDCRRGRDHGIDGYVHLVRRRLLVVRRCRGHRVRILGGHGQFRIWNYFIFANLVVALFAAGPATLLGLTKLRDKRLRILVDGALAAVIAADLSQLSKAETGRIWLLFYPWFRRREQRSSNGSSSNGWASRSTQCSPAGSVCRTSFQSSCSPCWCKNDDLGSAHTRFRSAAQFSPSRNPSGLAGLSATVFLHSAVWNSFVPASKLIFASKPRSVLARLGMAKT